MNSIQTNTANGARRIDNSQGQVAIEATVAIVAILIFLLGTTQIFIWMNRNIIMRQKAYQQTRLNLGYEDAINFEPKPLRVFAQDRP